MNIEYKKAFMPAIVLTVAVLLVGFLLGAIGAPQSNLYAIGSNLPTSVSVVTPTAANLVLSTNPVTKLIGFISGYVPIGKLLALDWIVLFLSSYLILILGMLIVSMGAPTIKGRIGHIASLILYGSAPFYLISIYLTGGAFSLNIMTILGIAIHTIATAYITAFIADKSGTTI